MNGDGLTAPGGPGCGRTVDGQWQVIAQAGERQCGVLGAGADAGERRLCFEGLVPMDLRADAAGERVRIEALLATGGAGRRPRPARLAAELLDAQPGLDLLALGLRGGMPIAVADLPQPDDVSAVGAWLATARRDVVKAVRWCLDCASTGASQGPAGGDVPSAPEACDGRPWTGDELEVLQAWVARLELAGFRVRRDSSGWRLATPDRFRSELPAAFGVALSEAAVNLRARVSLGQAEPASRRASVAAFLLEESARTAVRFGVVIHGAPGRATRLVTCAHVAPRAGLHAAWLDDGLARIGSAAHTAGPALDALGNGSVARLYDVCRRSRWATARR